MMNICYNAGVWEWDKVHPKDMQSDLPPASAVVNDNADRRDLFQRYRNLWFRLPDD